MARTHRASTGPRNSRKSRAAASPFHRARDQALHAMDSAIRQGTVAGIAAVAAAREAGGKLLARARDTQGSTLRSLARLEGVFEQRVGAVASRLGLPSAREVRALSRDVAELQRTVDELRRPRARSRA
ncbi:MAG TPA: phasin family protein [Usitatibacter sp.]|nr:phasin family protein [Usitatibacter sp.]